MNIKIKSRYDGHVMFAGEFGSLKLALEAAVKSGSDLSDSNLSGSNLSGSDLRGSDLRGSDLSGSDLSDSNLRGSNLSGSNLSDSKHADLAIAKTRILPDGDLIGWKKAGDGEIIKLRIPADARRSHAFGRKCRTEFAEVIAIIGGDGQTARTRDYGCGAIYRIGERVVADSWDEDFTQECSHGIHFFITRAEAEAWE